MNYLEEYNDIIEQAKQRDSYSKKWNIGTHDHGYVETHHIVPRCQGGSDDKSNLVVLTPQEHYNAHRLLALANPNDNGLQRGWWMMCHKTIGGREYSVSQTDYNIAKNNASSANSGSNNHMFGNGHKMSGCNHPMFGKNHTDVTKQRISNGITEEHRHNISVSNSSRTEEQKSAQKAAVSLANANMSDVRRDNLRARNKAKLTKTKIQLDDLHPMSVGELNIHSKQQNGYGWIKACKMAKCIIVYGSISAYLDKEMVSRNVEKITVISELSEI